MDGTVLEISDVIYLMHHHASIYMCIYIKRQTNKKTKNAKPSLFGNVMGIELMDTVCIFMY